MKELDAQSRGRCCSDSGLGRGAAGGWGSTAEGRRLGDSAEWGRGCEPGGVATATSSLGFGPRLAHQGSHVLGADLCPTECIC